MDLIQLQTKDDLTTAMAAIFIELVKQNAPIQVLLVKDSHWRINSRWK